MRPKSRPLRWRAAGGPWRRRRRRPWPARRPAGRPRGRSAPGLGHVPGDDHGGPAVGKALGSACPIPRLAPETSTIWPSTENRSLVILGDSQDDAQFREGKTPAQRSRSLALPEKSKTASDRFVDQVDLRESAEALEVLRDAAVAGHAVQPFRPVLPELLGVAVDFDGDLGAATALSRSGASTILPVK